MIYLDNAATTRVKPEVFSAMKPYFEEMYANASGIYDFAGNVKKAVEEARAVTANFIHAKPKEIFFTSGGTESDNWALKGIAYSLRNKGKHIITTKIEHHAILHSCQFLEQLGYEVSYIDTDEFGVVKLDDLEAAIRPDTILISVMFANNEIGTIQPIREIGQIAKKHGILFHTDAVQALGHLPIDVDDLHIDLLSASGHKFGGPKGIGILYIRTGVSPENLMHGGAQENSRRGGTYNSAGIIGFGKAIELASKTLEERMKTETTLRDYLIDQVLSKIPYSRLNGDKKNRLSNNANFSFRFVEGESLLLYLDSKGICASSGSACTSGALDPSHVLLAIGLPHEIAHGSLRFTLSEETKKEEIDIVVEELGKIVDRLRSMSPLYEDFVKNKEEIK